MPSRRRALLILLALCLLAGASFAVALSLGSLRIPVSDVWAALTGGEAGGMDVVLQLRLPRAIAGFRVFQHFPVAGRIAECGIRPAADH